MKEGKKAESEGENKSATRERGGRKSRQNKRGRNLGREKAENRKETTMGESRHGKKYEAAKTNQLTEQRERRNDTKVHKGEMRNDGGRKGE